MFRKILAGAAIVAASLGIMAPTASAATKVFAGVHPNYPAARQFCFDGIAQGRWLSCMYETPAATDPATYLWVWV